MQSRDRTYSDPEAWRHREEAGQQQLHLLGDGAQAGDQLGGEALARQVTALWMDWASSPP